MSRLKRVGIVADDITGANDAGVMLAKNGYRVGVFSLSSAPALSDMAGLDAVVINTDSRLDDPDAVARKADAACALLMARGFDRYHSKVCSVFRGNIGAHFAAVRARTGTGCAMVVAGFPRNGRTTVHGQHYVYGVPLAETMFRNDPIHPMSESSLLAILSAQVKGTVRLFDTELLDLPEDARCRALAKLKPFCDYLLFDVRDQRDLQTIARLVKDEPCLCGSSALLEELPGAWAEDVGAPEPGVLVVSGSQTVPTREQVAYLKEQGVFSVSLPTWTLLDEEAREALLRDSAAALAERLSAGRDALLHAALLPEEVARTMDAGCTQGLSGADVGRLVSGALGEIAAQAARTTGVDKIVVAGGETSAAVSDALGIRKMIILDEIEAGVPAMLGYSAGAEEYLLVFKSGSFGSPSFLQKSIDRLRASRAEEVSS